MKVRQPRYPKEEFARRGNEIYETQVRSQVEEGNHGKIVAIDIETGNFEVADDIVTASACLLLSTPMPKLGLFALGIGQSIILVHGV
jgi:hypothetical protein